MKQNYIISANNNFIKVFNSNTGMLVKNFKLSGDIINGPFQTGDQFTVIVKEGMKKVGKIYKLPNCFLVKNFNA